MHIVSFARTWRKFAQFAAFAALALVTGLYALPATAQKAGSMDKKAMQILQGMSDYLGQSESISLRARTFFDVVRPSGIKIKAAREGYILLNRPNQLYINSIAENGAARTTWFDGSKLTVLERAQNQYMTLDFSGTTDALIDVLDEQYQVNVPIGDLLFSNVSDALNNGLVSSEYIGVRTVNGIKTHMLSFESAGTDWQIWIEADATPVPVRFAITYVDAKGEPAFVARLDRWSIGGETNASIFKAVVPERAKLVPFGK